MKILKTESFVVTIVTEKPVADLCDHVASRLWSLDGVTMVDARVVLQADGKAAKTAVLGTTDPFQNFDGPLVDMAAVERIAAEALGDVTDVAHHVNVDTGFAELTPVDAIHPDNL